MRHARSFWTKRVSDKRYATSLNSGLLELTGSTGWSTLGDTGFFFFLFVKDLVEGSVEPQSSNFQLLNVGMFKRVLSAGLPTCV